MPWTLLAVARVEQALPQCPLSTHCRHVKPQSLGRYSSRSGQSLIQQPERIAGETLAAVGLVRHTFEAEELLNFAGIQYPF